MDFDIDFDGGMDDDIDFDGGMDFDIDFDGGMDMDMDADIGPPDIDIDVDGGMDMDMDADIGTPDIDIDVDGGMDMDMDTDGGPPMVDCEDATVLFYVYSSEEAEVTAAADELGMSYETASSASEFATKAAASMPDIVVFSTPSGGYDDSVRTTLQTHLDSGGKAITAFWNYDAYADLQTTLGVSVSGSIPSPPTLSSSDADPAFWSAYESLPDTFAPSSSSWGDNGDKWSTAGVESLAKYEGEPIIVLSNDGSTIVNGLLFDNFAGADNDGDGISDLTELVTNELYSLCGGGEPGDVDGGPPSDGGHVVLIGHDYFVNESTADQILANAVALGDSGGTIQIAAYTEYADIDGEYVNMLNALDTYLGVPYSVTTFSDEGGLDLSGFDVFMIPEQETTSLSTMESVGAVIAGELDVFVADGGVVIAADYSGGSWGAIASLFDEAPTGATNVTGSTLTIPDPSHPLVAGIDVSTYTAMNGSNSYTGSPSGTWVSLAPSGDPVVIHIGVAGGGDPGDFDGGPPMEGVDELDFPVESDTWGSTDGTSAGWLWQDVHYVSSSRPTSLATVSAVDLTVEVDGNSLSCDNDIFEVVIEGVSMGTFEVYSGDTSVSASFTSSEPIPIFGDVDIEYAVTETVDSGCGSVSFGATTNMLTLTGELL